jgi:hypothetical protein
MKKMIAALVLTTLSCIAQADNTTSIDQFFLSNKIDVPKPATSDVAVHDSCGFAAPAASSTTINYPDAAQAAH